MWALIPVKDLDSCKSRLAHALPDHARPALMGALLGDLLVMLKRTASVDGVAVVTRCPKAAQLARSHQADVLTLVDDLCLNTGVAAAIREFSARHIDEALILHADLPLINTADMTELIMSHRAGSSAVTLAPDSQQNGTNAMLLSLPTAMQFFYGQHSYRKHLQFCQAQKISVQTMHNANTSFDIDLWQDFAPLLSLRTAGNRPQLAHWFEQYGELFDWPLAASQ